MTPKDRATAIGNMHKNSKDLTFPEISREQTDILHRR